MRDFASFIKPQTIGSQTVVEFGSMFFDKLSHTDAPNKIGIEIWQPYIDKATFHDCKKVKGNFLEFESLIDKTEMDCALIVDALEHVTKEQAVDLITRIKSQFNKIVLILPSGDHPQEEDITGFGAHEYQKHRSTWVAQDISDLDFQHVEFEQFNHIPNPAKDWGFIFATWTKPPTATT